MNEHRKEPSFVYASFSLDALTILFPGVKKEIFEQCFDILLKTKNNYFACLTH